jgi:hypothetical protein
MEFRGESGAGGAVCIVEAPDHGNRGWKVALVDGNPASWEIGSIERIRLILIATQEFGQLFAGKALGMRFVIRSLGVSRIQEAYVIAVRAGDVGVEHDDALKVVV